MRNYPFNYIAAIVLQLAMIAGLYLGVVRLLQRQRRLRRLAQFRIALGDGNPNPAFQEVVRR